MSLLPDPMHLTDDLIIVTGGWNPTYARVLMSASDDDVAIVLVDGNGDGAELESEYWELVDTRGNNTDVVSWRDATSSTETASK